MGSTGNRSNDARSINTEEECTSDFNCGMGNRCVKAPLKSAGVCMKTVDEYGTPVYELSSTDSIGPNLDLDGECEFDTHCPIGFRCERAARACIKR